MTRNSCFKNKILIISNNFNSKFFQLTRIQNELYGNQIRKQETESELINARSEVRDFRQRINELNNKIGDLNRQIQDSQINKNRNEEKIRDLEKVLY